MRLTEEREKEIRNDIGPQCVQVTDLLAEIDALRNQLNSLNTDWIEGYRVASVESKDGSPNPAEELLLSYKAWKSYAMGLREALVRLAHWAEIANHKMLDSDNWPGALALQKAKDALAMPMPEGE